MSAAIEEVRQVRKRPYDPMLPEEEPYGVDCCGRTYCEFTPTRRVRAIGILAIGILLLGASITGAILTGTKPMPEWIVFPISLGFFMPAGLLALFFGTLYGWSS